MRKFACPSCGADVTFQSAQSVYAVCAYCQSMVVRTDVDLGAESPLWNDGATFASRDEARAAVRAELGRMPLSFKAVQIA